MAVEPYDILVLGGGVAGASAALFAARAGKKVALVSRNSAGPDWWDWLHPQASELLESAGVELGKANMGRIARLVFVSSDLKRRAACEKLARPSVVRRDALRDAISRAAVAAGAVHRTGCTIASATAGEEFVTLRAKDGAAIEGRILLAADGASAPVSRQLRRREARSESEAFHSMQWHAPRKGAATKKAADMDLNVMLAMQGHLGFGYAFDTPSGPVAGLVERGSESSTAERLEKLVPSWFDKDSLRGANLAAGKTTMRTVPRGAALDQETHVGKRTLFIGDCGGFVCALSQEGLLPAIRSAALAVQVASQALGQRHEQDALAEFDAAWRTALADVLRLPSTDFQFLMPLVFTNQAIATRMAKAFLLGENM